MGLRAVALPAVCLALFALTCSSGDEADAPDAASSSSRAAGAAAAPAPATGGPAATIAVATPTVAAPPRDDIYGGILSPHGTC